MILKSSGYNLGTPALKPHKQVIKSNQNDTVLRGEAIKNTPCQQQEKEFK